MKKLLIILSMFIFTTDSLASGIASNTNSAPCTNNTLETYSGNSNLAADWQPNEIQLRWYNNNTLMNVQSSANTCVYDSTLTVPQTAPTRTGYTFAGWTVIPEYDVRTLYNTQDGLTRLGVGLRSNGKKTCIDGTTANDSAEVSCDSRFDDLNLYEWKATFDFGTIYGSSTCSTSSESSGSPDENSPGQYCWCRVTGYTPINGSIKYAPSPLTKFIIIEDKNDLSNCRFICSNHCALHIIRIPSSRRVMFGITQ